MKGSLSCFSRGDFADIAREGPRKGGGSIFDLGPRRRRRHFSPYTFYLPPQHSVLRHLHCKQPPPARGMGSPPPSPPKSMRGYGGALHILPPPPPPPSPFYLLCLGHQNLRSRGKRQVVNVSSLLFLRRDGTLSKGKILHRKQTIRSTFFRDAFW